MGPVGGPTHRKGKQAPALQVGSHSSVDDAHVRVVDEVKYSEAGSELYPPVLVTVFGLSHCLLPCITQPVLSASGLGKSSQLDHVLLSCVIGGPTVPRQCSPIIGIDPAAHKISWAPEVRPRHVLADCSRGFALAAAAATLEVRRRACKGADRSRRFVIQQRDWLQLVLGPQGYYCCSSAHTRVLLCRNTRHMPLACDQEHAVQIVRTAHTCPRWTYEFNPIKFLQALTQQQSRF